MKLNIVKVNKYIIFVLQINANIQCATRYI